MTVAVVVGLGLAALAWAALFVPHRRGFWTRALVAGLAIGVYAGVAQHDRGDELVRPEVADVLLGVIAAALLYAVFFAGDRLLRRWFPARAAEVDELYAVRSERGSDRLPVPVVLVLVGWAEELFWRGFVQARAGFAIALGCYAAVHLWERKAVLVLAAAVGGAYWGALFAWRDNLVAPLVSHALWDLAVVVWFPFTGRRRPA